MDIKTAITDTVDPRPIKKATLYAFGSLLEGVAVGLLLPVFLPDLGVAGRLVIAGLSFVVGAVVAVSAYSALKRQYKIVEKHA